jgi:hypothetical protein
MADGRPPGADTVIDKMQVGATEFVVAVLNLHHSDVMVALFLSEKGILVRACVLFAAAENFSAVLPHPDKPSTSRALWLYYMTQIGIGDIGLLHPTASPDTGASRSHLHAGRWASVPELLSLCASAAISLDKPLRGAHLLEIGDCSDLLPVARWDGSSSGWMCERLYCGAILLCSSGCFAIKHFV